MVDLDVSGRNAYKTPRREICPIRADACNLPLSDDSFDLLISAFCLEHIPDWKTAVREMTRVGKECFLAFGPNRWFPYEIGHLDAPLAGTLPKGIAKYVAYAWLNLIGDRRTLKRIDEILSDVTYISSRAFVRACRTLEQRPLNLFPGLIKELLSNSSVPSKARAKIILRKWPRASLFFADLLTRLGLEPQMYYHISRKV